MPWCARPAIKAHNCYPLRLTLPLPPLRYVQVALANQLLGSHPQAAVQWYKAAAAATPPHADALYNLGTLLWPEGGPEASRHLFGHLTVQQRAAGAIEYMQAAADVGDASARFWLGASVLRTGVPVLGMAADPQQAGRHIELAAGTVQRTNAHPAQVWGRGGC